MQLSFQLLRPTASLPKMATNGSAGYDVSAALEAPIVIPVGEIRRIPLGFAVAPDTTEVVLLLAARSGLASKFGITVANGVGIIDSDYRGEVQIPLINLGKAPFTVEVGMRIAQLLVLPVLHPEIICTDTLTATERGSGGFGSTGTV